MGWIKRLFKRTTPDERWIDAAEAISLKRAREASALVDQLDQAIRGTASLSSDEVAHLNISRGQILAGNLSVIDIDDPIAVSLKSLWIPPDRVQLSVSYSLESTVLAQRVVRESPEIYGKNQPKNKRSWALRLTDEFVNSTCDLDRKLQGRIFQALRTIATSPTSPRGDTVKSLSGDLSGLWRYRLGDFRLIYKPDLPTMQVYLLSFGGRGGIYQ